MHRGVESANGIFVPPMVPISNYVPYNPELMTGTKGTARTSTTVVLPLLPQVHLAKKPDDNLHGRLVPFAGVRT